MTAPKQKIDRKTLDKDVEIRVGQAAYKLFKHEPFWATLLLKMERVFTREIPTMGVDGKHLFINPDFAAKMAFEEVVGVLLHEVLHVALGHPLRRGTRDPMLWNIAADYCINLIITDSANFTPHLSQELKYRLPAGCLHDPAYKGMNAEQVYDLLMKDAKKKAAAMAAAGDGQDLFDYPGANGDPGQAPSEADLKEGERNLKSDLTQANEVAKKAGKGSIMGERITDAAVQATVDWRSVLKRFVDAVFVSDYSWSRPNRRFAGAGLYLPSAVKEDGMGEIVVAVDTSGSIGQAEASQFLAEINSVMELNPSKIHIVYCDSAVQRAETFNQGEPVVLNMPQGGGTCFKPPFKWVEENNINPKALVYLTDLYGDFPKEPDYPTLWACITDQVAPWGETLRVHLKQ
jgi:predicted metal-dependent peptidase